MLLTRLAFHDLLRLFSYIPWDHMPGVALPTVPVPFHIIKNQENALRDTGRGKYDGGNSSFMLPFPS